MSEGITVLVCGSRDWPEDKAWQIGHALHVLSTMHGGRVRVIHGAARGADRMAGEHARKLGLDEQAFPADWDAHGKRAGILRNLAMLDEKPDLVLAFQRDGSRGTQHTINEAKRRGIDVVEYES